MLLAHDGRAIVGGAFAAARVFRAHVAVALGTRFRPSKRLIMTGVATRLASAATLCGALATGIPRLQAQASLGRSASLETALHSHAGQAWADALVELSRRTRISPAELATLTRALADTSAPVRLRGAKAAGALGPLAIAAVPQLVALLTDTVVSVSAEGAFALGVVRDRSEPILKALFDAALAPDDNRSAPALFAITSLGRYPLLRISSSFSEELRLALRSPTAAIRRVALRTAMRTKVAWALTEFVRLLADPDPGIRLDAAYALVGLGPEGHSAESEVARLSGDSVSWIRAEIPGLLKQLGRPTPEASPINACTHRANREGPAVSALAVTQSAGSLRDDRKGPYRGDASQLVVAQGTAFNFFLSRAPRDPGPAPDRPDSVADSSARFLEIDLTQPVLSSGATPIEQLQDETAQFHAFFMRDVHGTVWNLRDIPIGASIKSDRTELSFFRRGRYHLLQFGPWALGDCGEGYAYGAQLNGDGTTPITIQRVADDEFRFTAPDGSIGRLWEWPRGEAPKDRGLYFFRFDLRLFPASDR